VNISLSEIILVLVIAIIVVKPEQLPEIAKTIGRFAKYMKQAIAKIKSEMNELIDPAGDSNDRKTREKP
jgi:Sec-independent protein translocase protein TatA